MSGFAVLANYREFSLSAEYDWLHREFSPEFRKAFPTAVPGNDYTDKVYLIRAGYDFPWMTDKFIEPTIMYTSFQGDSTSATNQNGRDRITDIGVNFFFDKNSLKLNVHYV